MPAYGSGRFQRPKKRFTASTHGLPIGLSPERFCAILQSYCNIKGVIIISFLHTLYVRFGLLKKLAKSITVQLIYDSIASSDNILITVVGRETC